MGKKKGKRSYSFQNYSEQEKIDAVIQFKQNDFNLAQTAREAGCSPTTLKRWVNEYATKVLSMSAEEIFTPDRIDNPGLGNSGPQKNIIPTEEIEQIVKDKLTVLRQKEAEHLEKVYTLRDKYVVKMESLLEKDNPQLFKVVQEGYKILSERLAWLLNKNAGNSEVGESNLTNNRILNLIDKQIINTSKSEDNNIIDL